MQYEINPNAYCRVFVLPGDVVEKHIKLAGALQLKVLLWFFYHQQVVDQVQMIAEDLGASPSDVQDALQYWLMNGVLQQVGEQAAPVVIKEEPASPPAAPVVAPTRPQKPSRAEVVRRGEESQEVAWLLCEAQGKFNRTLTFAETSTLVWLMDTHGLMPAVILMIIEYATSIDKCNLRFIESTALRWIKEEIDTVDKADEYLTRLEQMRSDWGLICRLFGIEKRKPSSQEEIYITRWLHEWNFSSKMLKAAYDQCVNNTGKMKFPYINKVLQEWHAAGFTKVSDITEAPDKKGAKSGGLKRASDSKNTSYSMDDINQLI